MKMTRARRSSAHLERPVFVADGSRTPFLKATGVPGPFRASDLAVAAGRPLLARQRLEARTLDEVVLGCVAPGPDEANIARVVALRLGCGDRMPAWTVQRNCGSGLQAIDTAAQAIASGRAQLVLAGGTEAMSHHPVLWSLRMVAWLAAWSRARGLVGRARQLARLRPAQLQPVVSMLRGLTDPVVGLSMGQTAEQVAWRFDIARRAMDGFALESHRRAARAQDKDRLVEIEPLFDSEGRCYEADDGVRPDTDLDRLGRLPPVFDRPTGRVTAGNSAQISDGAAWLLLASGEAIERWDLPVLGRIRGCVWAGVDPREMGLGPVHAMVPLLKRHGLRSTDIDWWEINEAFAAQVLACLQAWTDADYCRETLGIPEEKDPINPARLNVDGGAIALGHPVGASGARIVLHLLHVMEREGGRRGVASLCIGGGQGGAMLLERGEPEG